MKPLKLPITWHRRFYEVTFIVSIFLVALFAVSYFELSRLDASLQVSLPIAIASLVVSVSSAVFFFLVQKVQGVRNSTLPSLTIYLVLFATISYLVYRTGQINSPFIPLWGLLVLFSSIFGAFGWVAVITLTGVVMAFSYIDGHLTPTLALQFSTIGILLPLIGAFLWREDSGASDEITRSTKNLASELSEVAAKSEIIINAIGDGVIVVDGQGIVELINPAAQKIIGIPKRDAIMLNYKSVLKLNDENSNELSEAEDPVLEVLNTNQQARDSKLVALTGSGKKINIALVVSPIGEAGSGAIAVFRDVTKERSEEREQAEFISTASHEMRTPVASIEGYLGLAMNPSTAQIDDRAKDFINKAHESAQHLGRLFQDLLDVSKAEDGRMTNTPKVVDITTIAQTVVEGLSQKAQEKGLQLLFKPQQSTGQKKLLPVFYVNQDNNHIREILDNLVENAIKYTPAGEVVVDLGGDEDKVIISVKDSGLGIPAEDIPHLFQKFYRVENMDRQEIGGTGLGLFLARQLAESMQGRLWVESVFSKGSTFFLQLPRISNEEATRLKEQQDAEAAAKAQQAAVAHPQPLAPTPTLSTTPAPEATAPQPAMATPATTVPRGELLSEEQKAARVRQLEELARQQRELENNGQ